MTISERIQKILESENLSPSQFADEIGVQRSSLSHILSGRNNPSFDYLLKILNRFENLDANWILTGKGSMYKSEKEDVVYEKAIKNPVPPQKDIFSFTDLHDETQVPHEASPSMFKNVLKMREDKDSENMKVIIKIIELYSDNTFAVYYPLKN